MSKSTDVTFNREEGAVIVATFRHWERETQGDMAPLNDYVAQVVSRGIFNESYVDTDVRILGEMWDEFILTHKLSNLTEEEAKGMLDKVSRFWQIRPTTTLWAMLEQVGLKRKRSSAANQ